MLLSLDDVLYVVVMCIIGNKVDLTDSREVLHATGKSLADQYRAEYYETSALSNQG